MDSNIVAAIIGAGVAIGGGVFGCFWKILCSIGDLKKEVVDRVGSVETSVTAVNSRVDGCEKDIDGLEQRTDRIDRRINGVVLKEKGKP